MTQKFVYVNSSGQYEESPGAYETSDFINSSAGAGDAGKPIVLDAGGHVDASMINDGDIDHGGLGGLGDDDHTQYILVAGTRAFTGDQSMGSNKLTNLSPGTVGTDAVNLDQLQGIQGSLSWKDKVMLASGANLASLTGLTLSDFDGTGQGVTLVDGNRVLLKDQSTASENGIYTIDGSGDLTRATDMDAGDEADQAAVFVDQGDEANNAFTQTADNVTIGSDAMTWIQFNGLGQITAGAGLTKTGNTLDVGAGTGITVNADDVAIDFSTAFNDQKAVAAQDLNSTTNGEGASIIGIEDASGYYAGTNAEAAFNELEAQIGGATSTTYDFTENNVLADDDPIYSALNKLDLKWGDLASTANGEGASLVGVEDSAGNYVGTDVEAVLAEIPGLFGDPTYTTDGSGVTKGDLVHISANNTVTTSLLTTSAWSMGLAKTTAGAASSVKVTANDQILTGVLVGATAGATMFWDGSAHTATIPATASAYVWKTGIAKNATDLHVEVDFIKKNSA